MKEGPRTPPEEPRDGIPRGDLADSPKQSSAEDCGGDRGGDRGGSGWITTRVAAEALGVNPRTVRAYIERGDLVARSEGEGIQKSYLVSVDSLHELRNRPGYPRNKGRGSTREDSAKSFAKAGVQGIHEKAAASTPGEDLTGMIRELTAELVQRAASEAELRTRLELRAQAESTIREQLERERERAERLEAELLEARRTEPEQRGVPEKISEGAAKDNAPKGSLEPVRRRSWLYEFFFGPVD